MFPHIILLSLILFILALAVYGKILVASVVAISVGLLVVLLKFGIARLCSGKHKCSCSQKSRDCRRKRS
jgi:hypothetical protein